MSVLSDVSNAGNNVELVGGSETTSPPKKWIFSQKVSPVGANARFAGDQFGNISDIDGDIMVVGTPNHPYDAAGDNALTNAGSVWIYRKNSLDEWVQELRLVPSVRATGDLFGSAVAVSGNTIAIGAPGHSFDASGANQVDQAGAVYIYTYDGSAWSLQQKVVSTGVNARVTGDAFGTSLDLQVNRLAVGAPNQDYNASGATALTDAGAVFVFDRTGSTWAQTARLVPTGTNARIQGDNLGKVVKLADARLFAQAPGQDYDAAGANSVPNAGAIYVWNITTGSWVQEAKVVSAQRISNANFGNTMDAKGSTLVASSSGNKINEIFVVSGSTWTLTKSSAETQLNTKTRMLMHFEGNNGESVNFVDEASNEALDVVTGTRSITLTGAASINTAIQKNGVGSLLLGQGNYASLARPDSSWSLGTGNFTLEWWEYRTSAASGSLLAPAVTVGGFNPSTGGGGILAGYSGNQLWISSGNVNGTWDIAGGTTMGSVVLNAWSHIALVRNGTSIKVYRDGVEVTSLTTSLPIGGLGSFLFGYYSPTGSNYYFPGRIADFRFTAGVARYTTAFTPPTSRLPYGSTTADPSWNSVKTLFPFSDQFDYTTVTTTAATTTTQAVADLPAMISTSQARYGSSALYLQGSDVNSSGLIVNSATRTALTNSNFTIECWVKPEPYAPRISLVMATNAVNNVRNIVSRAGLWSIGMYQENTTSTTYTPGRPSVSVLIGSQTRTLTASSTYQLSYNDWSHIAIVRNTDKLSLYVNGIQVATTSIGSTEAVPDSTSTTPIRFGYSGVMVADGMAGFVDEFRIIREAKYSGVTFAVPEAPFRFKEAVMATQGRGQAAAIYDESQVLYGLPNMSGFEGYNVTYTAETIPTTAFPDLNVDNGGAVEIITKKDGVWSTNTYLTAPGTTNARKANDRFGTRVRIKDSKILVTSPTNSQGLMGQRYLKETGAVYLFSGYGDYPKLSRKFVAANRQVSAKYGSGAAFNSNTVVISSPDYSSTSINYYETLTIDLSGFSNVTRRINYSWQVAQVDHWSLDEATDVWSLAKTITPYSGSDTATTFASTRTGEYQNWPVPSYPNPTSFLRYGETVAVSSSARFLISNPQASSGIAPWPTIAGGSVQGITIAGTTYTETPFTVTGTPNIRTPDDQFGLNVATDGTNVIVGAPRHQYDQYGNNGIANAGAAYSFTKNNSTGLWDMEQKILSPGRGPAGAEYFGTGLTIRSNNLVITAGDTRDPYGAAYLMTRKTDNTGWDAFKTYATTSVRTAAFVNDDNFAVGMPWRDLNPISGSDSGQAMLVSRYTNQPIAANLTYDVNDGKYGASAVFDGVSTTINVAPTTAFNFPSDFTIESRIKTSATTGVIATTRATTDHAVFYFGKYLIQLVAGKLVVTLEGTNVLTSAAVINDGDWHHFAISRNGTTIRLFIDGVISASATNSTALGADFINFGVNPVGGTRFAGKLENYRMYDKAKYTTTFDPLTVDYGENATTDTNYANLVLGMTLNNTVADFSKYWHAPTRDVDKIAPPGGANGRAAGDNFGYSVALENNLLAVGTPKHTYDAAGGFTATGAGAVALWEYSTQANQWFYSTKIAPSGTITAANANYGTSVDLATGGYMVVGNAAGKMQIHTQNSPGNWSYKAESGSIYNVKYVTFVNNALAVGGIPTQTVLGSTNVGGATWMDRVVDTWSTGSTQPTLLASRILAVPATTNGRWAANQINYDVFAMNGRKANDQFGTSVAISGDKSFLAIGSPFHAYADNVDTTVAGQGATYIYTPSGQTYTYSSKINRLGSATTNTGLGASVSFKDTYLAVGAPTHNSFRGMAQIYTPSGSGFDITWSLQGEKLGSNTNDKLGTSVTLITDSQLAVGIPGLDATATVTDIGGWAWTTRTNTTWSALSANQIVTGTTNGRKANDQFGTSIAIDGSRMAIGAVNHSYTPDGEPTTSLVNGAVFTYVWTGTKWIFEQKVKTSTVAGGVNNFGRSVGLKGDTLVVGSPSNNRAWVFDNTGGTWSNADELPGSESELAGQSVAVVESGYVVTGSPNLDGLYGVTDAGGFQTWRQVVPGLWSGQGYYYQPTKLPDGTVINPGYTLGIKTGDALGTSIAMNNNYLAIGVPGKENALEGTALNTNTGVAYVYAWNATAQKFKFDIQLLNPTNYINDAFGAGMVLSDDRLVVGSLNSASNFNRGGFYVYDRTGPGAWANVYSFMDRQSNAFGRAIALPTKDIVVSGTPNSAGDWDDFKIANSGSFKYIYKHDGAWTATGLMVGGEGGIAGGPYPSSFAGKGYATGGGGAGARGGAGGTAPVSDPGAQSLSPPAPGQGGTNLVPPGGLSYVGNGLTPGLDTDVDRGIAGQGGDSDLSASYDGQPGRVVISYDTNKQIFDYTGADQTFIVPDGVTALDVKLWGAGGGAGEGDRDPSWTIPGKGGGAGAVTGSLVVTPGETLTIMVGQGGLKGVFGSSVRPDASTYGWGGRGGNYENGNAGGRGGSGGNGGGLAAIFRDTTPLAIAGGGGGASGSDRTIVTQSVWQGLPGGTQTASSQNIATNKVSGYANGRSSNDHFGSALKLGQGYVAIGAPRHNFNLAGGALPINAGATFLYRRTGQTWEYKGKLNQTQPTLNGYFGSSISISDNHLAIGSSVERPAGLDLNLPAAGGGVNGKGSVEVFRQTDQDVWVSDNRIDGLTTENAFMNYSTALVDDGKLVVAYPGSNTVGGASSVTASGGFQTFANTNNTWSLSLSNVTQGLSYGRFAQDKFGTDVKVGQDFVAISAPGHSYSENGVRNIANMGAAFVFRLDPNNNAWVYETLLTSPSAATGFGTRGMALSGQNLLLGGTTAAQLFTRDAPGSWTAGATATTGTNSAVTLQGDKIITGQTTANIGTGLQPTITNAGAVQQYDFDGSVWTAGARLTIPGNSNGRQVNDQFGYQVALSTDGFLAISSPVHVYNEAGNSRLSAGAVSIFGLQGQTYKFEKLLNSIKNQASFFTFGRWLDVDGSTIWTSGQNGNSGPFYGEIILRVGAGSYQTINTIDSQAQSGYRNVEALTIVNPNLFVQGTAQDDGTGSGKAVFTQAGGFRTMVKNGSTFTEKAITYAPGLNTSRVSNDQFATSAAMSKEYIVMGAPGHDFDQDGNFLSNEAGAVWVFKRINQTFELVDMFIAPSGYRSAQTRYGQSVAISSDGQHIVVGAPGANVAFAYSFNGKTMTLMNILAPTGNFGADDRFGQAVAVNKGRIAIGAPQHNFDAAGLGSLNDAGAVYTYKLTGGATWTFAEKFVGFSNNKPYDKFDLPENMFDTSGPNGRAALDLLGSAVAISNHRAMIVGGPQHDFDQLGQDQLNNAGAAWLKYLK